jgi:hypothetical protein
VPDVIAHPGLPLDDLGDAPQGPHLAGEPYALAPWASAAARRSRSAADSRAGHRGGLCCAAPGRRRRSRRHASGWRFAWTPRVAGDLGSTCPLGGQVGRLQAAGLAVGPLGGRANTGGRCVGATDQGGHARILPYRSRLRQIPRQVASRPETLLGSQSHSHSTGHNCTQADRTPRIVDQPDLPRPNWIVETRRLAVIPS